MHSGRSHKIKSLDVKVQKLSFYFFLLYAMRMHSCFKIMCVRCFYVLVMLVQRRRLGITVFCVGMLGPEAITGLCYTEAAVLYRIWEPRQAQYKHV